MELPPTLPLMLLLLAVWVPRSTAKVVQGHLRTREQWAFLTRFCFLSGEGKFSYQIEYDAKYAVQKLLLYYDTDDQWPAIYNTGKTCSEKLSVLSDPMRHQFINLSSQLSTFSGCEMRRETGREPTYFCVGNRTFISSRERWWFIAVSNCDSEKGLDLKYDFLMTNGPEENSWLYHFSADEMLELRNRGLFHTTYKLFMASLLLQTAGLALLCAAYARYAQDGVGLPKSKLIGRVLEAGSDFTFLLLLLLCAKGYTITRGRLRQASAIKLTIFLALYVATWAVLFVYEQVFFDPGEVLYLYESPGGYGLMLLKLFGWAMFIYSTSFTIKHYPEKWSFYLPFSMYYTVWFLSAPMVIMCSNYLIDKWVREKVVNGVEHGIAWCGQVFFLILTRPTAANKNFPFHVRTSQISIMEQRPNGTAGNNNLDHFSAHPYAPSAPNGGPWRGADRQSTPTELFVISAPQMIPSVPGDKPYIKQDASFPHQRNGNVLEN
ncbi:Transmembrane protein 145 [Amphibalanus amphitrite]|uniref:Transmembrane protein 145 n=1 Tax=Amphibalanus amphitrite TaxID=1232801 RepID=A0A6A4VNG8_AMPAM|nr:Transmembrane protein 145 [Amphibalanus amphitrite]